ncbi:RND efflux system, membrane fusion protein [Pseudomonas chlororaphis subsp. aurantiaca]|uniref:RND efflux system, membrane fusion protein n=3 Tax=Pseudomonas chlororaphis TaxID=587753 RepID=A0AAD0ZNH8_9PSED|nr:MULTISPECIES: efflux RND transporter periplasmic adaptor subunit [Pseudomonas]AZD38399.1 RND efflux system, membrane fusion protein [Pseudomonas chlororaphis subsp. aurantiaca]AZD44740.1 RND efflux system, membrane fusion protein [Pseudomonas chlororaphis subsp. aurantiaca]AZD75875.1 RND efflux system, membrane fusion protein [Pseudomonas chlororaphis subsp. aurantiaca]AZD82116.1 RND efflux system, membrane fusion protein [Pseudomonas chlororaphis subsp. aurantiaca]AZE32364.1 RND efflux sys
MDSIRSGRSGSALMIRATLACAVVVALVVVLRGEPSTTAKASVAPPAAEVDVAMVLSRPVTDWQNYSGRLEAVEKVVIRPLVSGTIVAVHFKDGAIVKEGDLLFEIDARPYAARVEEAQASLAAAKSRSQYTATDLGRAQRLINSNAIAMRDLDEKQNAASEAQANVRQAQAILDSARLDLAHTRITAPVSGRMSNALVTTGNIVSAGENAAPLSTLVSLSPIYAAFDVDEQTFLRYLNQSSARPDAVPVMLGLSNETDFPRVGKLASLDNQLDLQSATLRVRASFDNADGLLRPGMLARIKLGGGPERQAVLIDDSAIGTDQDKKFVLVVTANDQVEYRRISPGNLVGNLRIIDSGLQPGERVVINGLHRARPGDTVRPLLAQRADASTQP